MFADRTSCTGPRRARVIPPISTVFTTWHFDLPAAILLAAAAVLYGVGVATAGRKGHRWPISRTFMFYVLGLGSYAVISFGILSVYSYELRWAFTTRVALLLFCVPWLVGLGKPVALAEVALDGAGRAILDRFLNSRFMRLIGNAVFEPLFTLAIFMLFVTPFAAVLRTSPISQIVATVLIPLMGLLQVTPIMEETRRHTAVAITFEFIISFGALIFDALPGILLRLHNVVLDGIPTVTGAVPGWFPSALRDQQLSGDILWFLAEVADIPVLIILFVRWARIDRGEAQAIDELSDEEMDALTQAHLHRQPGT
ncbi:cytochrome c oxidase assembly protein [Frondihabitans sp. PAMC 28766]|uniref:cytochrome c oxidase assembly protein n=1 Tax=Frondihabitans sp. PAMC 28766 TaxID=1795630 RepID=UPI001EF6BB5F|nr:cytochrome c oxidase assembly protein [Frondihabitans sp. PAMC 28766]